jgi:inosine-uridine nucleoside N-ribohydrolase
MTKKDISEKLKRVVVLGGAVGEGTMAPSGT